MAQARKDCGAWCATATLEDGSSIAVPIRCRSWDCPHCAATMKRRLLRRLRYSKPNLFSTLTTSTRTAATPDEAFIRANAAISTLIKRWRRRFPNERVEYFLVWERTKAGWPHAHLLLVAPPVSKHWLSATWRELTGSYIVDLQPVSSLTHAAKYLAKYLAKDPQTPPGFRRWRRSAGFFRTQDEPKAPKLPTIGRWTREPHPLWVRAYLWMRQGLKVWYDNDGKLHSRPPMRGETDPRLTAIYAELEARIADERPGLL